MKKYIYGNDGDFDPFNDGDDVQVKYGAQWKGGFTYKSSFWTSKNGRQYNVEENGDLFSGNEIRKLISKK